MKNNSALFYTCSLIEFIGRKQKLKRSQLVGLMGRKAIARIYRYADVLHCEPIEKNGGRRDHELQPPNGGPLTTQPPAGTLCQITGRLAKFMNA